MVARLFEPRIRMHDLRKVRGSKKVIVGHLTLKLFQKILDK
jgi:hypothetical protein